MAVPLSFDAEGAPLHRPRNVDWRRAAKVDAATRRLLKDMDSDAFGALVQLA